MKTYTETDTPSGVIGFNIFMSDEACEDHASVSTHRGRNVSIDIPAYIDHSGSLVPVTQIERKAFLSDRYIVEVIVPDSVLSIGEWAFAGCRKMKSISLHRNVTVANGAFKDCEDLTRVELSGESTPDTGFLLAAVIRFMDAGYLFDLKNAGTPDWYANWDMRLTSIMGEPDEEGFSALLACGEEDYEGKDNTLEAYLSRRRRRKIRLCMIRLMHDHLLLPEMKKQLESYLYEHRAGTDSPDSWRVVLEEHGDEEEYYELLNECGCIDTDNINGMLKDMGDRHAGMKSYLIRLSTKMGGESFFDGFEL